MHHLHRTATTSSYARKQTVKKSQEAVVVYCDVSSSLRWGLRFFRTETLLPMTQSAVSTGIFLVKLKTREAGSTLHEVPAPRGLWVRFSGGLGAIPKSQMNGPFIWEEGGHTLANRLQAQDCLWSNPKEENTHTPARGKDWKSRKGANSDRLAISAATHSNQKQNVPEAAKKLGVQPERRGWKNRYGQCLFVTFVVLLLERPPFACWSAGSIVCLKIDLGKFWFGETFAFKMIGWLKVLKCWERAISFVWRWWWNGAPWCVGSGVLWMG